MNFRIAAAACGRLTAENYDKLKVGMAYDEVKGILGAPARCTDLPGVKSCVWGDDKRSVTVNFIGEKAVLFSSENLR
ncbi:MAG: hypothetical protein HZB55_08715 [Deltaproteobacteria bacterium]|nr:hypothetical protein [Deltaproteobacteria bacterium]